MFCSCRNNIREDIISEGILTSGYVYLDSEDPPTDPSDYKPPNKGDYLVIPVSDWFVCLLYMSISRVLFHQPSKVIDLVISFPIKEYSLDHLGARNICIQDPEE